MSAQKNNHVRLASSSGNNGMSVSIQSGFWTTQLNQLMRVRNWWRVVSVVRCSTFEGLSRNLAGAKISVSSRILEFVSGFIVFEQTLIILMTKSQWPGTKHLAYYRMGHLICCQHLEGWVTTWGGNVLRASGASSSGCTGRKNRSEHSDVLLKSNLWSSPIKAALHLQS